MEGDDTSRSSLHRLPRCLIYCITGVVPLLRSYFKGFQRRVVEPPPKLQQSQISARADVRDDLANHRLGRRIEILHASPNGILRGLNSICLNINKAQSSLPLNLPLYGLTFARVNSPPVHLTTQSGLC